MSTLLVDSGYPALPFFVGDHGIDSNRSVTIASGSGELAAGTILKLSGSGKYNKMTLSTSTAAGILFSAIDATNHDVLGAMYVHGVVRSGSLSAAEGSAVLDKAIADLQDQIQFV